MGLPIKRDHNVDIHTHGLSGSDICIVNDTYDPVTGRETSKQVSAVNIARYIAENTSNIIRSCSIKVPLDISTNIGESAVFIVDISKLNSSNDITLPARLKFIKDGSHFFDNSIDKSYIIETNQQLEVNIPNIQNNLTGVWNVKIYDSLNRIFESSAWSVTV